MLTVDYDRLGVGAGDRLLDVGCGAGRHALEAARRGAAVVALDADLAELASTRETVTGGAGPGPHPSAPGAVQGDATVLPFADGAFDRIIAAEVLEHVDADGAALSELHRVLRPGGTLAVTVPRWLPERVCWALAEDYHAPAVAGGHVRIYRQGELAAGLREAGLIVTGRHHVHSLHTPYWWLKCAVGVRNDAHPLARTYHRFLVWDMFAAHPAVRLLERALDPLIGKSLVLYTRKPPSSSRPRVLDAAA